MNIVREQRGENNSLIRVTVGEADYGQEVEKSLREYKRKANIPGFRPGMVPMGIVKKMYGKGVLAEQSYRQASNAVFEYLQKEGIDYLGDVIPAEEQGDFDFDNATEFEFVFEIGEAPEIKLELSDKDKLTYNKIKVDKKMHDDYRSNYLRRFGRLVDAEKVTSDEALSVTLDNGEMNVADAYVGLISMDEADRKPFIGKKVGDKMKVNINELYKNPAQRAACLQVKENELEGVNPEFELEITKIRKFAEPELNEEFFKMAFPQGGVTDEAGLDKFIDAQIEAELRRESDYLFTLQVRDYLVKKADLKMPAAFLKRWLYTINEGKFSMEDIEKDFDQFLKMFTWNYLQKHFIKTDGISVSKEEALSEAKALAASQFAQYGMPSAPDDMLEGYAEKILADKEQRYGTPIMRELERICLLKCVDRMWMDHIDNMDQLRQGIALRGYGQKDPVVEYRIEGFDMFDQMVDSIRESSVKMLLTIEIRQAGAAPKREQVAKPTGEGFVPGNGAPGAKGAPHGQPVRVIKIGRNDPCPCGSGLKWKKCTCAKYHPEGTSTNEN